MDSPPPPPESYVGALGESTGRKRNLPVLLVLGATLSTLGGLLLSPRKPPPVDALMAADGWADERSCIDCHQQAAEFASTGHARTLCQADDPSVAELLATLTASPEARAAGLRIDQAAGQPVAVHTSNNVERSAKLDWCFGSGTHARTWLGLLDDSWGATDAVEFRWTWYAHGETFDLTPGQPLEQHPGFFGGLGVLYDYPKTRRCFGCHATRVAADDGHLHTDSLIPGVQCQRCHGPRGQHVSTEKPLSAWSWRGIDRDESVHRCAECHRGATEQKPADVRPDNIDIARFQPVGLVQAPCFQNSTKMTCVTCHNPHRPMSAQDSLGDWQCTQCHDGQDDSRPHCGADFREDCLKCHMPKVQWSPNLQFTDHWIRVRESGEMQP